MIAIVWPLLIAVAGFLMRAFMANENMKHLGEVLLWCGVLWTVYLLTGATFQLGHTT